MCGVPKVRIDAHSRLRKWTGTPAVVNRILQTTQQQNSIRLSCGKVVDEFNQSYSSLARNHESGFLLCQSIPVPRHILRFTRNLLHIQLDQLRAQLPAEQDSFRLSPPSIEQVNKGCAVMSPLKNFHDNRRSCKINDSVRRDDLKRLKQQIPLIHGLIGWL